jgi:hypothetical protein
LFIVTEWLRLALDECRAEARVHPRNQNVWRCGVERQLCAHERIFLNSQLVGHPKSTLWYHAMLGGCWLGGGEMKNNCRARKQDPRTSIVVRKATLRFKLLSRHRYGAPSTDEPTLKNMSSLPRENEHGFVPLVDAW